MNVQRGGESVCSTGPGVAVRPLIFFLPGLLGEDDPEVAGFLHPLTAYLDLVQITYFDWAKHVETGCDYSVLAEDVLRQIEARAPEGPVRIAGYSLGGHLAFATAAAIEKKGRAVASLAVLDAPVDFASVKGSFAKRMRKRIENLMTFKLRAGLASAISKWLIQDQSWVRLRSILQYRNQTLPVDFHEYLHRKLTMQLVRKIYAAWWRKTLQMAAPVEGILSLFRSQEHEPHESQDLGWGRYCRNVRVIPVAGTHRKMFDPAINGPMQAAFVEVLSGPHDETVVLRSASK
jgi:thioesterase domain-containing protein